MYFFIKSIIFNVIGGFWRSLVNCILGHLISVGNMMQCVFLDGNLLDEVVLDGNLLDELRFDSNLFVKYVKMMYLQISSKAAEKEIPVSAREMINLICHNVYAGLMKETHVWRKCICYFYEGNPRIHLELVYTRFLLREVAYTREYEDAKSCMPFVL